MALGSRQNTGDQQSTNDVVRNRVQGKNGNINVSTKVHFL